MKITKVAAFKSALYGLPASMTALSCAAHADDFQAVHLACDGVATFTEHRHGDAFAFDNHGNTIMGDEDSRVRGQSRNELFVDLTAETAGRIKLPGIMIPTIHTGSEDGWRAFDTVKVGNTEIIGRFTLNPINKPRVSINRVTGHIDVLGFADLSFSGDCRPYDASAAARRF